MTRVLITGAAGLLGQHLVNQLLEYNTALAIDKAPIPFRLHKNLTYLQEDLLEFESISRQILDFGADIIYNCAAYTDVDCNEKNQGLADKLNCELVRNLAGLSSNKIVHISTDYVFNGKNGPYSEDDEVDPISFYGKTKLKSEEILRNSGNLFLIIRSNVLFGRAINVRPNFVTWIIDSLRLKKRLRIVNDQFNNPISANNLAQATIEAANLGLTGALHIAGADYLSRFEMAIAISEYFNLDSSLIEPITSTELGQAANRPLRGGLQIDKARKLLKTKLLGFKEGLESMADY